METYKKTLMVTGGAGFIGSHVVRLFVNKYPEYRIVNVDKLTYAGNLANLKDIEGKKNYKFVKADIVDAEEMQKLFTVYKFDGVIHLAAESHVDRSIASPSEFIYTNIVGTANLLNAAGDVGRAVHARGAGGGQRGSRPPSGSGRGPWVRRRSASCSARRPSSSVNRAERRSTAAPWETTWFLR